MNTKTQYKPSLAAGVHVLCLLSPAVSRPLPSAFYLLPSNFYHFFPCP